MAVSITLVGGAIVVLFSIYKYLLYPALLSPLAKIPAANFSTRFSSLWINYISWKNLENNTLYQLHQRLGRIVRLGPNELSVDCYKGGLKTIYNGGFSKTKFYHNRFLNYGTENSFPMIDKKKHSDRKKNAFERLFELCDPVFSHSERNDEIGPIRPSTTKFSKSRQFLHATRYSFMAYQFGLSLGSDFIRDAAKRNWYLDNFFGRRPWIYWITEHPGLASFTSKFGLRIVPKFVDESTDALEAWQIDICDKAEALLSMNPHIANNDPKNFPAVYAMERAQFMKLDGKERVADTGQAYPRRLEIASDMYDHNAAAHETSGDTLTYLYYEMSRRPDLQAALRTELQSLSPQMPSPAPDAPCILPDPKHVDQLPLLDAILQETLRRWVAVPGPQFRCTPLGGTSLAGYDNIPAGVRVSCLAYSLHRNPEVFPEPLEWKPERWLNATPKELRKMRHWFWAWGSGGHMCIGSNFAIHSMKHAVAALYSNFTTEIFDAEGIEQAEGFTAGPIGEKLILRFEKVADVA
ncbi:hypothetical protein N0V90_000762 [Kalmusia sp. IMI 367209]|nr:hypothetical protein N0V90_000762 [Kalmusia sp. IMI 367209]